MDALWKLSFTIAGLGAIGSFVLWSLYRDWLRLKIFPVLTKRQAFRLMQLFLILTFAAFATAIVAYIIVNGAGADVDVSGYILYDNRPLSKADDVRITSQVDARRPSQFSLTEDGRFAGDVSADARRITVRATVNGKVGSVTFDPSKKPHGNEIRIRSRGGAFTPIGDSVSVLDASMRGPIDRVRIVGGDVLPYAACRRPADAATLRDVEHMGPQDCFYVVDIESSVSWATIEEVVVRVNRFREPPPILDKLLALPAMQAHVAYVQIDNPEKARRSVFTGEVLHEDRVDYLVMKRSEPERLYVLVNALSPGVYEFDLGIVIKTRDGSETRWLGNSSVYFHAVPKAEVISGAEALRLLTQDSSSSDADRWLDVIARARPAGAFDVVARIVKDGRYRNIPSTDASACVALAKLDGPKSVVILLSIDLRDSDRASAVAAGLRATETNEAFDHLTNWLTADDMYVRRFAASSFKGKAKSLPEARAKLIDMLLNDPDRYSRHSAAEGLSGASDQTTVTALRNALKTETDDMVRVEVARSLAMADPKSGDLIINAMMRSDVFVDDYVEVLTSLNEQRAVCHFVEFLRQSKRPSELVVALTKLTGEHFGYINVTTPDETEDRLNERVVRRWMDWWESARATRYRQGCS